MVDQSALNSLVDALCQRYPFASVAVDRLPSGAFMLDVRLGKRFFVLSYAPQHGFGVGEVVEGDAFDTGAQTRSTSIEQATRDLMSLLDCASRGLDE
jgi:hypothetical protein